MICIGIERMPNKSANVSTTVHMAIRKPIARIGTIMKTRWDPLNITLGGFPFFRYVGLFLMFLKNSIYSEEE